MRRYVIAFLSLTIVVAGSVWVGLGTPGIGGDSPPAGDAELTNEALDAQQATHGSAVPSMREVIFADENLRGIIGSRVEGQDYWLNIQQFASWGPDGGGMATIAFARPVSFSGEVLTGSQPCRGHGNEGDVDPDDPCLDEAREYSNLSLAFSDMRVIHMEVDLQRGELVALFPDDSPPHIVDEMIAYFQSVQRRDALSTPQIP